MWMWMAMWNVDADGNVEGACGWRCACACVGMWIWMGMCNTHVGVWNMVVDVDVWECGWG